VRDATIANTHHFGNARMARFNQVQLHLTVRCETSTLICNWIGRGISSDPPMLQFESQSCDITMEAWMFTMSSYIQIHEALTHSQKYTLATVAKSVHRHAHMVETPSHFKFHTVPLGNI
jgi:hypothetical protein